MGTYRISSEFKNVHHINFIKYCRVISQHGRKLPGIFVLLTYKEKKALKEVIDEFLEEYEEEEETEMIAFFDQIF